MVEIPELKEAEHLITMVIEGRLSSVILVSEAGLGKSHLASKLTKCLVPDRHIYSNSHITPLSLYKLLYNNREKIIILDDVEELFANRTAIGILKSALGEVDGKRKVCYYTTSEKADDVPESFEFQGGVIILCNEIPCENSPVVRSLASRSSLCKIYMNYEAKLRTMNQIIEERSDLTEDGKALLKDALRQYTSPCTKDFNLRTSDRLIAYYQYSKDKDPSNKELYMSLHRATIETDEAKSLVWELMQGELEVKKQVEQFRKMTGHERATFFRIKREFKKETSLKVSRTNNETVRLQEIHTCQEPENKGGVVNGDDKQF